MARTRFVSVNLTEPGRDALQMAAVSYSALVGRRLSMSAAVLAALEVASRHQDEVRAVLAEATDSPDPGGPQ